MKQLKTISFYLLWTVISILLSVGLKYLELGNEPESDYLLAPLFDWVYDYVIFVIGSILGVICAIVFFVINYSWINPKITRKKFLFVIQLLSLVLITFLIAKLHYIVEFDLDYI